MLKKGPWLGQVPLVLRPSFRRPGMVPAFLGANGNQGTPPYYGQWGVHAANGKVAQSGQVGPFDTQDEAFNAALKEARNAGARALPSDGFAKVMDSQGQAVGPTT